MGVTPQTVSMWENGTKPINLDDYLRRCVHFGFDAFGMIRSVIKVS